MVPVRRGAAARVLAAALLAVSPLATAAGAAEDEDAFPPYLLLVEDVTGDRWTDVVVGQPRIDSPFDWDVRAVDGLTGKTLWREAVHKPTSVTAVSFGDGERGFVVANSVSSGVTDDAEQSLRLRGFGPDGDVRWERTFEAHTILSLGLPNYVRPGFRGVLPRRDAGDLLLVQSTTRIEGGANRVVRTTPYLLDVATGATVADHPVVDTLTRDAGLVSLTDVTGDGDADYGLMTFPSAAGATGAGTFTAYDTGSGAELWSADVRAAASTLVRPMLGGDPPAPVLSLDAAFVGDGGGVQLLDPATGEKVVDVPVGDRARLADGTGKARRLRVAWFSEQGSPNSYTVALLDLKGRTVRKATFPIGTGSGYDTAVTGMYEAGDVDGDGWTEVVAHNGYASGENPMEWDHRLIDGRTLGSVRIAENVHPLAWNGPRAAAVDGRGDDLYSFAGRAGTVIDGRTRRKLLDVRSADRIGVMLSLNDGEPCADVLVMTFDPDDVGVTRFDPYGRRRWGFGARTTARDVSGAAGCAPRVFKPAKPDAAPPERPAVPPRAAPARTLAATGGATALPGAALTAVGVLALRRRRAARERPAS